MTQTEPMTDPTGAPAVAPEARRRIAIAATLLTACALVGTALSPYLLVEHPLLLLGLNPDSRHLVLVANRVELWQAVSVASVRRGLTFASTFALATIYGSVLVSWLEKKQPWLARPIAFVEAIHARVGVWLVVLVPFASVAAFAGIARTSWRKFVLAIIPGQVAFALALLWFGEAVEAWTEPVIAFIADHSVEATLAAAAVVAVLQLWSRIHKRDTDGAVPSLLT